MTAADASGNRPLPLTPVEASPFQKKNASKPAAPQKNSAPSLGGNDSELPFQDGTLLRPNDLAALQDAFNY